MGASIQRGRRGEGAELDAKTLDGDGSADDPTSLASGPIEAEILAIAAWFEALPLEWRLHFDREARRGREGYLRT